MLFFKLFFLFPPRLGYGGQALFQFFAVKFMPIQQACYSQNNIFFTVNAQNLVTVLKIEVPFCLWEHFVNMRLELPRLYFSLNRCFENVNHFCDKVANKLSRLSNDIVIPILKPSSIFSRRSKDSL